MFDNGFTEIACSTKLWTEMGWFQKIQTQASAKRYTTTRGTTPKRHRLPLGLTIAKMRTIQWTGHARGKVINGKGIRVLPSLPARRQPLSAYVGRAGALARRCTRAGSKESFL